MALDYVSWLSMIETELRTNLDPIMKKFCERAYYAGYFNGYSDSFAFGKLLEEKRKKFLASLESEDSEDKKEQMDD